jgi:hypothetical protein
MDVYTLAINGDFKNFKVGLERSRLSIIQTIVAWENTRILVAVQQSAVLFLCSAEKVLLCGGALSA